MRTSSLFFALGTVVGFLIAVAAIASVAGEKRSIEQDRAAIEHLHQLDVTATLSGKADDFAKLWDNDGVRIQPGIPAEVGKVTIYDHDKRAEPNSVGGQSLCYEAELKDLQIVADWAFEWGYFSYKESANAQAGRGKVLRVIRRQPDGSWKFVRVMNFTEESDSAAPMSHPCK